MHKLAPDQPAAPPATPSAERASPGVLLPRGVPGYPHTPPKKGQTPTSLETLGTFRLVEDNRGEWLGFGPKWGAPPGDFQRLPSLAKLDRVLGGVFGDGARPLLGTGWAGFLAYDLAGSIEPGVRDISRHPGLPLAELHRVDLAASLENEQNTHPHDPTETRPMLHAAQGKAAYIASVARALAYIRAGDIYQANIAHQFIGRYTGSAPALFAALTRTASPRHGFCLTSAPLPDGSHYAILSLSPELFLSFDAQTRRLTTRPMKGTRPGHADPAELREATKDRAELAMIVDLMRNDLGRVCEFGSIEVECARTIEHHGSGPGSVLQATATVSGTVREGLSTADILAATFPPGSVTGTPKIRAMQIIHELEPFARGPYCGCLGTFADDGSFELAVAIRTAVIQGRTDPATGDFLDAEFSYCVGAGIVADSDPEAEWQETLDKARVLEVAFDLSLE